MNNNTKAKAIQAFRDKVNKGKKPSVSKRLKRYQAPENKSWADGVARDRQALLKRHHELCNA